MSVDAVDRDLPKLLALLHRAQAPFATVQATYRIRRHQDRRADAVRGDIHPERRRSEAGALVAVAGGTADLVEQEEILRIWRAGDRLRQEHQGGPRDGTYGIRGGEVWWTWDPRTGTISSLDNPPLARERAVGAELAVMLDPTQLLGSLKFTPTGRGEIAGRPTITADAVLRPFDPYRGPLSFAVLELGWPADSYILQVDAQRGVLLEAIAVRAGRPFRTITTMHIVFDQAISDERFRFEPPAGEPLGPGGSPPQPQPLTVLEAQQRAPFTVLIPDRMSTDWHMRCVFIDAYGHPASAAQVVLDYRSENGPRFSVSQLSAAARNAMFGPLRRDEGWEEVGQDGTVIRVTTAGAWTLAHLDRDGTFVFLASDTLASDELAMIAANLRPAPVANSI